MNRKLTSTIIVTFSSLLFSCNEKTATSSSALSMTGESISDEKKASTAEDLYRAGVALSFSENFPLADTLFSQALAIDPHHAPSLFYKANSQLIMKFEGIGKRVMPIAWEKQREALRKSEGKAGKEGDGTIFYFKLKQGDSVFETVSDYQAFAREMMVTLDDSIAKLDSIKGGFIIDYEEGQKREISTVDISMWINMYRSMRASYALQASFNLDDLTKLYAYRGPKKGIGFFNLLKQYPDFLTVKEDAPLHDAQKNLREVLSSVLETNHSSHVLCQTNQNKSHHGLFQVFCARDDESLSMMRFYLGALEGTMTTDASDTEEERNIEVDLSALFHFHGKDLKEMMPTSLREDGMFDLPDPTFGGIIPNGDLFE